MEIEAIRQTYRFDKIIVSYNTDNVRIDIANLIAEIEQLRAEARDKEKLVAQYRLRLVEVGNYGDKLREALDNERDRANLSLSLINEALKGEA